MAQALGQHMRPGKRLLHRDLLVEQHADQQGQRRPVEDRVGGGVLRQMQRRPGHDPQPGMPAGSARWSAANPARPAANPAGGQSAQGGDRSQAEVDLATVVPTAPRSATAVAPIPPATAPAVLTPAAANTTPPAPIQAMLPTTSVICSAAEFALARTQRTAPA